MNLYQTIKMAFKSIYDNKIRSILTMLGVIIGVSSVIILVTLITGVQKQVYESFTSMGTNQIQISYYDSTNTMEDLFREYTDENLSHYLVAYTANASTWDKIRYKDKEIDTNINFIDQNYSIVKEVSIVNGRNITYSDIKNRTKVAIIGERIRIEFFGAMDPIGKSIKIQGEEYLVIGVLESKYDGQIWSDDDVVLLPSTLQRKLTGETSIRNYTAKGVDNESTTAYVEEINEYMQTATSSSRYGYFSAWSNNQWIESSQETTNLIALVAAGIAGISLLVGGIGIMNIMLVSVTERTREIGIRMAIGARRRDIIMQFLIEAGAVSAFGGILGILLGILISVSASYIFFEKAIFMPSTFLIAGAFTFSAALGIIFGLYPANKASKLQPVDALRTQ